MLFVAECKDIFFYFSSPLVRYSEYHSSLPSLLLSQESLSLIRRESLLLFLLFFPCQIMNASLLLQRAESGRDLVGGGGGVSNFPPPPSDRIRST